MATTKRKERATVVLEGLAFEIPSSEMRAHCEARVAHHRSRVEFYSKSQGKFHDIPEGQTSEDPKRALESARARHKARATYFEFLAKHVPVGAVYRLDVSDLATLEFIDRSY